METAGEERRKTGKAVLRHPRAPTQTAGISVQTNYKSTSETGIDHFYAYSDQCSLILAGRKDPSSVRLHWCEPHWRGPRYQISRSP
ncbi:hypothetical protein PHYPO_G00171880 [Pangasianodon hypophthalmus]|uniref:Uncharacterized protein n=1 Tax=Pangasianodon hypophthalmus TaxID=310915 RepID=A0A5N5JKG3_PANHP|nr:hypothetical protein PHYPO_G00171880 [Pangasianodon hypophthalmus]